MKTKLSIRCSVLLAGGWVLSAHAVDVGDSLQQVIEELGHPDGFVKLDTSQVLYYARGRVEVTDGKVSLAELVSAEEAEARRIREEQLQAQRQEELRLLREQRYAEGKVALEQTLLDAEFLQAAPTRRVAYWETFKRTYPEVPLPDDYYAAIRERDLERQERRVSEQLADLNQRAQRAEERARLAEERAFEAERRNRYSYYDNLRTYPRYVVPYTTYNVYDTTSRHSNSRHDRSQKTTVRHYLGSSIPQATYRPYESIGGYGSQRATGSSVVNTPVRCGPLRASDGVNANISIRF